MFDFDQYENNSDDYEEAVDMILYDFNIRIEHVKEKIEKIYNNLIKKSYN